MNTYFALEKESHILGTKLTTLLCDEFRREDCKNGLWCLTSDDVDSKWVLGGKKEANNWVKVTPGLFIFTDISRVILLLQSNKNQLETKFLKHVINVNY